MDLDNALEEGELSNDSDGYTPLERPPEYSSINRPVVPVNKQESDSDGMVSTSSAGSDSDSDLPSLRAKKPKVKVKKCLPKPLGTRKRKYDVWSNRAQEDSLLAMTTCDVSQKDRSRNVESYDYSLARKYYAELEGEQGKISKGKDARERLNNKRNRADRKDSSLRLKNKSRDRSQEKRGEPRILMDIVKDGKTDEEVATELANKLCEEKEDLILKIVNTVGADKAIQIYMNVKRIEAEGGMLIMNQSRRRTPGGVYLFLLKRDDDMTPEQRGIIFEDEKRSNKEFIKAKKKKKADQMKQQYGVGKSKTLPVLLTKAELVQKLNDKQRTPKDNADDVVNPPPTPETDGHVDSGDTETMEDTAAAFPLNSSSTVANTRVERYEDDFLDLSAGNDMDMF